jgi:serine/threonine protein kinase
MDQERWKQIDDLFDAVLDLPEPEREAFLTQKCGGDEDLKKEVLSLLGATSGTDNFLEKSAMGVAARNLAEAQTIARRSDFLGQQIGTYKIEKPIGAGGMGEVYLAYDEKLKRKVALKILPAEYNLSDERVKRFELEARAISALNHPYIVTIYDVGNVGNVNYIATEFVEGKTLRELIGAQLKIKDVIEIILQACDALSAAHAARIIHRDIKPENIMIRPDGYVKILDFGLAKLNEIDLNTMKNFTRTAKGIIIGTPAYMSPEQVADDNVDHRTDLWSVGVVLYELLTGVNPFRKENRQTTFQAILSQDPPLASSLNAEIPAELDQILIKALEKDADLSYQTASDLRADLKRVKREIDSSPSLRSTGGALPQKTETAGSRRPYLNFAFAFLACAVLVSIAAFLWWKYSPNTPEPSPWNDAISTQLTDLVGEESYPSISPDGKTLLYTRATGGNHDIFWQRIGGSNAQNLTADSPENDTQPAFSPNGERIAFRSERSGGGIFVMGATGESVKRLTDFGFTPAWSPDGNEIIFSTIDFDEPISRSRTSEIWAVNLEGVKRRINTNVDATQPQFSPNGKLIAFWGKDEKYQRDLWTIPASGGDAVRVTDDEALDWNPVWSPDGKFIYFCSNRNGATSLWRIPIDESKGAPAGEPEAISPTPAQSWLLTISKDGKNLIYVRRTRIENIQQIQFDPSKKEITGKPSAVTEGNRRTRTPSFSPDGSLIAFYITGETQEDIVLVKNGETKRNLLTNDAFRDRVPRFSPDGKRLAFYSNQSGTYEIYTVNTDGTDRRQITNHGGKGVYYPIFSPDGKQLAYTVFDGTTQIMNLETEWSKQTPVQVPPLNEQDEKFIAWSWSPDGKKLAGWRGDQVEFEYPGFYVYSFETNSYEQISDKAKRPFWLADSRHLIAEQNGKLIVFDSVTKTGREVFTVEPQSISSPFLTPDNKRLVFSVGSVESDIQMLSLK